MKPLSEARNIMVRTTNWVGDAVMTIPALRELRRALPSARITLLARPWVSGVFEREELADRIMFYGAGMADVAAKLRAERFDAALLLQNAFKAALVARWTGIPTRCGYARDGRSFLLTHAVPVPRPGEIPGHECYYYLELLRRLGVIPALPVVNSITLNSPLLGRKARGVTPRIGMSPGAAFGTAKRWPAARFVSVGRALATQGAALTLFGSASERGLCDAIAAEIGPAAESMAGRTTLTEFIDQVSSCDLFITNDSGTMHVAAAAGVPTLAIFGPTDETGTAPLGRHVRLIKRPVSCSPCKLRHCPIDHRCMQGVLVEDVLAAAAEMLKC